MAITAAQLDVRFSSSGADRVRGDLRSLDDAVNSANSGFQKFQNAMLGLGAAMIPVIGTGINFAMNMEQAMADVNASLGGVDTSVLAELEQGFLDIGAASQFSAVEVAAVGDELARAGFDPSQIVAMTDAVVMLSQATGTDLMTSTTGISAAMQIWSEEMVGLELALTDVSRVADLFTVAANASSASVQDIIAGVRNFGPTAASWGIGFDQTSAAIALFTNYGLKAADSGVSLTRAMENLNAIAQESPEILEQFGITLTDLEGNFVGLPALFDQLNVAFGDMDPASRNAALSMLFGAEALDVMTIAALSGGDPMREILALMEEQGVAAEQSALRMNTLKAQLGELMESATNLAGRLVSGLMPGLRGLVDIGNMAVDAISRLPRPILSAIGAIGALAAGFATLKTASGVLATLNRFTGGALPGGALLSGLATPLLVVAAAAGALYLAIRTNFLGIGDAAARLADRVDMLGEHFRYFLRMGLDPVNAALVAVGRVFPSLADEMQATQRVVNDFTAAWQDYRDRGLGPVAASLMALGDVLPGIDGLLNSLADVTTNLGDAFQAAIRGDWSQAFEELQMAASAAWNVIQEIGGALGGLVVDLAGWTLNVAAPAVAGWIVSAAGDVWGAISAAAGWAWDGLVELGAWTLNVAAPTIAGAASTVWEAIRSWAIGETGGVLSLPSIAVSIGGWIQAGAMSLFEQIKGWVMGETGGVLSLPNIAVSVGEWISAGGTLVADFYNWIADTLNGVEWNAVGSVIGEGLGTAIRYALGTLLVGGFLQGELFEWLGTAFLNIDWMGLASAIGAALVAALTAAMEFARGFISGLARGLFGPFLDDLKDGINDILGMANAVLGTNFTLFDTPTQRAKEFTAALEEVNTALLGGLGAINPPRVMGEPVTAPPLPPGAYPDDIETAPAASDRNAWDWLIEKVATARTEMQAYREAVQDAAIQSSQAGSALETVGNKLKTMVHVIQGNDPFEGTVLSARNAITAISTLAATMATAIPPVTLTVTADTSAATAALGQTAGAMAALNGTTSTVRVAGDNAGALAAVATAAGAIGAINGLSAMTIINGNPAGALGAAASARAAVGAMQGYTATAIINAVNNVSAAVSAARAALASINGATATAYINVVSSGASGLGAFAARAGGGTVREPLTLVGEQGPELVSLPYGSYVHNASRSQQMSGGDTYHFFEGATFIGTSREEMNRWAEEEFLPLMANEQQRHRVATGVT